VGGTEGITAAGGISSTVASARLSTGGRLPWDFLLFFVYQNMEVGVRFQFELFSACQTSVIMGTNPVYLIILEELTR
jgi:hypothetical protein